MSDHTFDASDWHERPSIEAYKEYHGISYGRTSRPTASSNSGLCFSASDVRSSPLSLPGDRLADKLVAYVHVGAELARLLQLFVDGSDPMEATDDALAVLDVWRSLEAAALREVVGS